MRRDIFQAIADPVRRDIIALLADKPRTVNDVAHHFDISRPAVSKHLKILNQCGVIKTHRIGRERYCEIEARSLLPVSEWVLQYRSLWEDKLDRFEQFILDIQEKKNTHDKQD